MSTVVVPPYSEDTPNDAPSVQPQEVPPPAVSAQVVMPSQTVSQQVLLPQQILPQQIVQVAPLPDPAFAFEYEAIKASYQRFVIINLEASSNNNIPADLSSRGLSDQTFNEIIKEIKSIKSTSNTNKVLLWTSCICCCGIIGFLLVHCRAIGNKKLSHQLTPVLEATNQELGSKSIMIRFAWVQGNLRAYFI